MHVKVDKAGRKIISMEIDHLFASPVRLSRRRSPRRPKGGPLAERGDFSFLNDDLKTITNAVGKNQTRVGKDHVP
jgi:hypothetical protein